MSRPEDIPEAVLNKADELWTDLANYAGGHTRAGETLLIARAIMAAKAEEREACAEAALAETKPPPMRNAKDLWVWEIGQRVAAAIRKRGDVNTAHTFKNRED